MESVSMLVKVTLPSYLKRLPIPSSLSGFVSLTGEEWLQLLPFLATVSLMVYVTVKTFIPTRSPPAKVNQSIKKDNPKVVNLVEIEDLDKDKVSYCRCWRSSKFPLCDGSHNKHNESTGDNVGPLVIKRGEQKAKA